MKDIFTLSTLITITIFLYYAHKYAGKPKEITFTP